VLHEPADLARLDAVRHLLGRQVQREHDVRGLDLAARALDEITVRVRGDAQRVRPSAEVALAGLGDEPEVAHDGAGVHVVNSLCRPATRTVHDAW
jgi:hypothetical protein